MPYTPSRYYKYPEGQDLLGKFTYATRYTGTLGLGAGIMDSLFFSKPKGYLGVLGRILYWSTPALGMTTAYICTTYIATNVRQKDDSINCALGGAAAGSILGTWRRSAGIGIVASLVFATAAFIKKEATLNDYTLIMKTADVVEQTVGITSYDLTYTKELPGNWTDGRSIQKE